MSHQSTVRVNGLLWAVHGDTDSHGGGGALIASYGAKNVRIQGILVICAPNGDTAQTEPVPPYHTPAGAKPNGSSSNVRVYG